MSSHLTTTAPAEQHDGYTIQPLAPVTIGATTFTAHEQHFTAGYDSILWLVGPRGAAYTLRPAGRDGLYTLISFNSGAPMKRHGNPVLVRHLGDIIEAA